MRQIVYRIKRFDGKKQYVQEYTFAHEPSKTILWGLTQIKETMDSSLTFVAVCRVGECGACAVTVNGQACLACETPLDIMLTRFGDTLTIGPVNNFAVIRDLVVDWDQKVASLKSVKPWLIPQDKCTAQSGCRQTPAEFKKIVAQNTCILCGACASQCNKLSADSSDFLDPFIFAKAEKFVADSRDKDARAHLEPALAKGLWKCVECQECVEKCPRAVEPAESIARLRQASIRLGFTDNPGARHALAFQGDITDTGRLNEAAMAVKTEGLLKSITRLPFALKLLRRGKLNPLHKPAPVKGIKELRAIIKAVKEAEE